MYENFDLLRNDESFHSYLFTLARRLAFKTERRKRRFRQYEQATNENMTDHTSNSDSWQEMHEFRRAVLLLPENQKEAFILFKKSGVSWPGIQPFQGSTLSIHKPKQVMANEKLLLNPIPAKDQLHQKGILLPK